MTADSILSVRDLVKRFGGVTALDGVSMDVSRGDVLGLIGPNGAGKTTLMNVITSVFPPTAGTIRLNGDDVTDLATYEVANRGLIRTFQENRHFENVDGFENIRTALIPNDVLAAETYLSAVMRGTRKQSTAQVYAAAELVELHPDQLEKKPSDMTHLERTKLSVARAAVHDPALLMLDEPYAGLTSNEREVIASVIRTLNGEGITVILIDHNVGDVVDIADEIAVLDQGTILTQGLPDDIIDDEAVQRAYFGE